MIPLILGALTAALLVDELEVVERTPWWEQVRWWHGTHAASPEDLFERGVLPWNVLEQLSHEEAVKRSRNRQFCPLPDRVYASRDHTFALIHALGGCYVGFSEGQLPPGWRDRPQIGLLLELFPKSSPWPDEDWLGEWIEWIADGGRIDDRHPEPIWNLAWYAWKVTPERTRKAIFKDSYRFNECAYQAQHGKQVINALSHDKFGQRLLGKLAFFSPQASFSDVLVQHAWALDIQKDNAKIGRRGEHFFEIATELR